MDFLEMVISHTILKTYYYLEETGRENSFERFSFLAVLASRLADNNKHDFMTKGDESKNGLSSTTAKIQKERFHNLISKLSGSGKSDSVIEMVVCLVYTAMEVPEFAAYLNYFTGNYVTLSLAYELLDMSVPRYAETVRKLKKLQNVFNIDYKKIPLTLANIEGDHSFFAYLTGEMIRNPILERQTEWFFYGEALQPMYVRDELAQAGAEYLTEASGIVQLAGAGGRRFLARNIAARLKKDLLMIKAEKLLGENGASKEKLLRILHEVFLYDGIVCIYDIHEEVLKEGWKSADDFLKYVADIFSFAQINVLLCTDAQVRFLNENIKVYRMALKPLQRFEREKVWSCFAQQYGLTLDAFRCAVNYQLNASEIAYIIDKCRKGEVNKDQAAIAHICFEEIISGANEMLGQMLEPTVHFDDIAVPAQIQKTLREICYGAVEGYRIYEEFNLGEKFPYGRAISVLLAGPPGTGKTMTAHALANEIGIPLYQVDLSHIIDKYIGETEKHLEQVFTFAEKTRVVLFFDEADSLFGRRGEVVEGKDRYANMEISYILQRIEQFDGVVVLATNFYNNIDKAFLRRMKYVLKYQSPDEKVRYIIWEKVLPDKKLRESIDILYLSRQFELTGGMIKNIIQNACITALYEKQMLNMGHILTAIQMEYEKMERSLTNIAWGAYEYLIK